MPRPADPATQRINLQWLLRFRSGELLVQLTAVLAARFGLGVALPFWPLLGLIAVGALANVAATAWFRRSPPVPEAALAGLLALDVLLFSGLLALSGGPYNSFSFLYVIQIALGAMVLSPLASVVLALLCLGAFGALFSWHIWLPLAGAELMPHELHHLQSHVQGMWLALLVAGGFIVYFLQRLRRALAGREAELQAANALVARTERLASLATLAAGAAHELSTPLSTIAVVAGELERRLSPPPLAPPAAATAADSRRERPWGEALDDVALVRREVDRCRRILIRMASHAGQSAGEPPRSISAGGLLAAGAAHASARPPLQINAAAGNLRVPVEALAQALQGLVRNAQQASPADRPILVQARRADEAWVIEVVDRGVGMAPAVVDRAGEPFFTTKAPGEGMGLGLFLARATVEQLGGHLQIDSQLGRGTRVQLVLPGDEAPDLGPAAAAARAVG